MKEILKPKTLLLLIIAVLGTLYVLNTYKNFENDRSKDVLRIARSIIATFPKESLKALEAKPGDLDKLQYKEIKNILESIIRVNPDARFAYLFTARTGKLYFMADSEPENSKDYSPPGQEYTEAKSEDRQLFRDGNEHLTGPLTDRWGTWMSTLTPIKDDATGKIIAVLGIDYNIMSWQKVIVFEVVESSVLIVLLLLTIMFLFIVTARNKSLALEILNRKQAENKIRQLNENLEARIAERTSQLEHTNSELASHTRELEQFTYIASHDLQEPLRTLTNFTQLLQDNYAGKLDEDGNRYIDYIYSSTDRMRALVSGLLKYSLLGKEAVKSGVDCNKIVGDVLSDLNDLIIGRNATITVHKLPFLNGYAMELRLLFQNLITNAIKFQKKDILPELDISAGSSGNDWIFSISDNGIGIDDKHKEKIFIIFKRMHNRNDYEGTGIGLAHCKKIVELHGGKIWVESTLGEGSIFKFTIPKS